MIRFKNIRTLEGKTIDLAIESREEFAFNAEGTLLQLPALIDPFARFTPDRLEMVLKSGISTLLIAPATSDFQETAQRIRASSLPLHMHLYMDCSLNDISEIGKAKKQAIALCMDMDVLKWEEETKSHLDRLFQIAAQEARIVAVKLGNMRLPKERLRSMEALLEGANKYNSEIAFIDLFYPHEIERVQEAKQQERLVYGATLLNLLYRSDSEPQLEVLWEAIDAGTIEMIGSGEVMNSLMLPLLLHSGQERKLSLEKLINLTRRNVEQIFHLEVNNDIVLVNLQMKRTTGKDAGLFSGKELVGWPLYTIVNGTIFVSN